MVQSYDTLLQNATNVYYILRQFYCKLRQFFQNAMFITKPVGTLLKSKVIFVITENKSFLLISCRKAEYTFILFLL